MPDFPRFRLAWLVAGGVLALTPFGRCEPVWDSRALAGCGCAAAGEVSPNGPNARIRCDFVKRLDVDYLNDEIPPYGAFDVNQVEVQPEEVPAFKVYVLTDDPRIFGEVTQGFTSRKIRGHRNLEARVYGIKGRFLYNAEGERILFIPRRKHQPGVRFTLEFSYRCRKPLEIYRTRVFVTLLPAAAGGK